MWACPMGAPKWSSGLWNEAESAFSAKHASVASMPWLRIPRRPLDRNHSQGPQANEAWPRRGAAWVLRETGKPSSLFQKTCNTAFRRLKREWSGGAAACCKPQEAVWLSAPCTVFLSFCPSSSSSAAGLLAA